MSFLVLSRPFYRKDGSCGYCKHAPKGDAYALRSIEKAARAVDAEPPSSTSMGFHAYQFSPDMYDRLIQLGFRRSGHFTYKPDNLRNCCRMYTIRTSDVPNTKEHRHAVNRFIRNITGSSETKKNSSFSLAKTLTAGEARADPKRFYTRFGPAAFSKEKYDLYRRYQQHVHQDREISEKGFKGFLCDSPFDTSELDEEFWEVLNGRSSGKLASFGPVHECYYIDEKLCAIAVLDVLPSGISSVYFIWDPAYASWGLGTIGGLREVALTQRLGLAYYYLGFYIADCHKMKYKAKFGGEILDLATYEFWALKDVSVKLQDGRFATLVESATDETVPLGEFRLDYGSYAPQRHELTSGQARDVSENVYGVGRNAYTKAERFAAKLSSEYGLKYYNEHNNPLYVTKDQDEEDEGKHMTTLPFVVPGILPLWQVYCDLTEEGRHRELKVRLFDSGLIREMVWDRENSRVKRIIVDSIRLLGWGMIDRCIVDVSETY